MRIDGESFRGFMFFAEGGAILAGPLFSPGETRNPLRRDWPQLIWGPQCHPQHQAAHTLAPFSSPSPPPPPLLPRPHSPAPAASPADRTVNGPFELSH